MLIRQYTENDLPQMIAIWNEVVSDAKAFPQESPLDYESGKTFFASQSYCGIAAEDDGTISGLYILHPNNVGRCSHICNASYAVAKSRQGRGTGKKLVENSLKIAKNLNFKIIQFNAVVATNSRAIQLYLNLGFQRLGKIEDGFRKNDGTFEDIELFWRKL